MLVSEPDFIALANYYPNLCFVPQSNTYFDTEDRALANLKCSLRIRELDGRFEATLKIPEDSGVMEYSYFVDSNNVDQLNHPKILGYLHSVGVYGPLKVIGNLQTNRATIKLEKGELCFDINTYGTTKDLEIEYEQTEEHNGKKVFSDILKQVNLKYTKNCLSKVQRCLSSNSN
ncbi:MAG: CYTH domain-containing protein [Erysipelotrichaceae bacterium]